MGINPQQKISPIKKLLVARLHLKNGEILFNQLISIDADGHLYNYQIAKTETPYTEWIKGDFFEK